MRYLRAELLFDGGHKHGEGPFWDPQSGTLGWVDIGAGELHLLDPRSRIDDVIGVGRALGAAAPRRDGGYVLAVEDGFALLRPGSRRVEIIASIDNRAGRLRMNDGRCDPHGRFWAGTMAYDFEPGAGSLYRLEPDGQVAEVLSSVTISNGLDWAADGLTMYYIDSMAGGIDAFAYDGTSGTIQQRRRIIDIANDPSSPAGLTVADGMTLDAVGSLWVAVWGTGEVRCYSLRGELQIVISLPVMCPTSCAFGGPALDVLYITTMPGPTDEDKAGAVFACCPGVAGRPTATFFG